MKKLIRDVEILSANEYQRASLNFGPTNSSDHESYAIILEEFEEAFLDIAAAKNNLDAFWEKVKSKESSSEDKLLTLQLGWHASICAASEFIQVAAMFDKAIRTIDIRLQKEGAK